MRWAETILRGGFAAACVALVGWAAYAFSRRLQVGRSSAERWLIAGLLFFFFPYLSWYAVSVFYAFDAFWAPVATLGVSGIALYLSKRWRCAADLRRDLRHLAACFKPKPESLLYLYPVALAVGFAWFVSICHILAYPTWSWDCVWYHLAQTRYIIQEKTLLYWVPTHIGYINGYPRLVETTSAFATLLLRSDLLDDSSQLGWTVVGALAVAAWSRRFSSSPTLAVALGLGWILCPAVFLQAHTTHADIAAGAQFIALSYFVFAPRLNGRALALAAICAGLLLATKVSGLLLVAMLAPAVVLRILWQRWRGRRGLRIRRSHILLMTFAAVIGLTQPVHNVLREGNPFYPARVQIPFTQRVLPGTIDEAVVANGSAFFADPGSFRHLIRAWTATPGVPFPDIRERPFGLTFLYMTCPLLALALLASLPTKRFYIWTLVYVVLDALMVPAAWWGRFVLGVPAAALIGCGVSLELLGRRFRVGQLLALGTLGTLAVSDLVLHFEGYRMTPSLALFTDRHNEERLRNEMRWMFTYPDIQRRDADLGPGDVWAYDEAVQFLGEHWNSEVTSRAVFVSSEMAPERYLAAIRAAKAKWVSVRPGTPAEYSLAQALGAQLVARHRFGSTDVLRIPQPAP